MAAAFALNYPERVEKLVLMSVAGLIASAENMARIRTVRMAAVNDPNWPTIKAMFDHLLANESDRQVVSVRFHGEVVEEKGAAPVAFNEVWHLVKPNDDSRAWAIAGIEQVV